MSFLVPRIAEGDLDVDLKLDPRLKKFFDSNKKPYKRAQCLAKFVELTPDKEADLFIAHSHSIYSVLERSISFYESLPLKKKENTISSFFHADQYAEVDGFCTLMKLFSKLIYYCSHKIREEYWNFKNFCRIAGRAIERTNTPELRTVGLEMLLQFIENLRTLIMNGEEKGEMNVGGVDLELPLVLLEEAINLNRFYTSSKGEEKDKEEVAPKDKRKNSIISSVRDSMSSVLSSSHLSEREMDLAIMLRPYDFATDYPSSPEPTAKDDIEILKKVLIFIVKGNSFETTKLYDPEIIESERRKRIKFWYKLVRDRILTLLYPQACSEKGIHNRGTGRSISGVMLGLKLRKCPPVIQSCLIDWYYEVLSVSFEKDCICDSKENMDFIIEILHQGLSLPHSLADTTSTAIKMYEEWINGNFSWGPVETYKQEYISRFASHQSYVFYNVGKSTGLDGSPVSPSIKEKLCTEALGVYRSIMLETSTKLTRETWDVVLIQLLDIGSSLAANASSTLKTNIIEGYLPKPTHLSPESTPSGGDVFLAPPQAQANILSPLLKEVYDGWARSKILERNAWQAVYDVAPKLLCIPGILKWKQAMLEITLLLSKRLREIELAAEEGDNDDLSGNEKEDISDEETKNAEESVNDVTISTFDGGLDALSNLSSIDLQPESALLLWDRMLHVLGAGNPQNMHKVITDPIAYELAIKALTEIIDVWLGTETQGRVEYRTNCVSTFVDGKEFINDNTRRNSSTCRSPHIGTILSIFGSWLFRAAELSSPIFINGRCAAIEALCRIFCCHTIQSVEMQWVSRFSALIFNILNINFTVPPFPNGACFPSTKQETAKSEESSNRNDSHLCIHTLLQYSAGLFGMGYNGFFILVPHYLAAIDRILSPTYKFEASHSLRKSILHLLSSLISILDCYGNCKIIPISQISNTDKSGTIPFALYRLHVRELLRKLTGDGQSPDIRSSALWSLVVDLHQILASSISNSYTSTTNGNREILKKVTPEKGLTIQGVLNDAGTVLRFIEYCDANNFSLCPRIWVACQKIIPFLEGDAFKQYAMQLYNACNSAPSSSLSSSVPSELLAVIHTELLSSDQDYNYNMFEKVQEEVTQMMERKLLPGFIQMLKSERENAVTMLINVLLDNSLDIEPTVAQSALECLSSLSTFEGFDKHYKHLPVFIVNQISMNITGMSNTLKNSLNTAASNLASTTPNSSMGPTKLKQSNSNNSSSAPRGSPTSTNTWLPQPRVVVAMLYCLGDWLLNEGSSRADASRPLNKSSERTRIDLLSNPEVNPRVFKAIEDALMGRLKSHKANTKNAEHRFANWPNKGASRENRAHGNTIEDVFMAAESLLLRLTNLLNAFPLYSHVDSSKDVHDDSFLDTEIALLRAGQVEENVTSPKLPLMFAYQGCIMTLMESFDSQKFRFIMRDVSGKYVWEWELTNCEEEGPTLSLENKAKLKPFDTSLNKKKKKDGSPEKDKMTPKSPRSLLKSFSERNMGNFSGMNAMAMKKRLVPHVSPSSDRLNDLMSYIEANFDSGSEYPVSSKSTADLSDVENRRKIQADEERRFVESHPTIKGSPPANPLIPCERVTKLDQVRIAFAHLGFLEPPNVSEIRYIEPSEKFLRELAMLDKTPSRESIRVGVLYVGKNQISERQILGVSRNNTSQAFNDMVDALGWEVDLVQHKKNGLYMGHLSPKFYADEEECKSTYFSTCQSEVMFHVTPHLPTDHASKQISRKKIIGADPVVIVWCEHFRDYQPDIISSGRYQVHIIIYSYQKQGASVDAEPSLFRVEVCRRMKKGNVAPSFGPLLDGMIVSKDLLPQLVRQTALNAHRCVQNDDLPYQHRRYLIHDLTQYYSSQYGEEDLYSIFF